MPSKKRKYNARFPAGRIKRIMQADEEVGKIAQAVPVIISRTLELFVESLLTKSSSITSSRNAKTLSPSHLKQCIMSEQRFDFLKDLVKSVPDITMEDGSGSTSTDDHTLVPSSNGMLEPNGSHRISLHRSVSLQPSTASATVVNQPTTPAPNHSQYHQLQQQKFYLNNYTNHQSIINQKPNNDHRPPPPKIARINSSPATATITSEQQSSQQKQLPSPLAFPIQISYNIDGSSSSSNAIESPAVKIDYSKFALPATSPSIKIDLSNFNQQVTKPTAPASGLDEDYDI
ncbi:CLUMA_CG006164, isoform A [Clunio marinus]|uniref:CLUMA_CG006164, isoform A n=1 Tax=Clunio marinus TaxID=568069 RepID=A0A1J1I1A9_9DIPT|nr:CLUMA_CG006164, isoform A [Clunio marinus]